MQSDTTAVEPTCLAGPDVEPYEALNLRDDHQRRALSIGYWLFCAATGLVCQQLLLRAAATERKRMALPQELAVDRPLTLGRTFNGNTTDGFLTYRYDFQPDSMQRVSQGDLLFFGDEQEKITFIPELPEGDAPFYYEGPCSTLQQQDGEDTECVAFFDGTQWILELVSARITAKHVRGTPQIPGYNIDVDDEAAAAPEPPSAPPLAEAAHPAADDDIDQDLNDALDEALFAADTTADEHKGQHQLQPAAASPPVLQQQQHQVVQQQQLQQQQQQQPLHQAVQQQQLQHQHNQQQPLHQAVQQQMSVGPAEQQKVPQQQAETLQQEHMQQQEHSEQDPDDPWAEYDSASAAPAIMQAAPAAAPPSHVTTAARAQPSAAGVGGVCVVTSHEEGQSEEEDQDEDAVHACSDDDSDGLGVEVF